MKTQLLIAESSAESELYGIVKASCEALGTLTLAQELGGSLDARVHVDAAAAKGIAERSGFDKVRHIDVNVLWLQEQEARGRVPLHKIDGVRNPADLMTKYLDFKKIAEHIERMNMEFRGGRAEAAAQLYGVDDRRQEGGEGEGPEEEAEAGHKKEVKKEQIVSLPCHFYKWKEVGDNVVIDEDGEDEEEDGDEDEEKDVNEEISNSRKGGAELPDRWVCRGRNMTWTREHRAPRSELFHPAEADMGSVKPQSAVVHSQNERSDEGWSKILYYG